MINVLLKRTIKVLIIFSISLSAYASDVSSVSKPEPLNALLKQIVGVVLINHGKGYSMAHLDMPLMPGDRVLTMDGASAVIVQNNGCVVKLKDNSIFMLKLPSECQAGKKSIRPIGPYYARAIGSEAISDVSPNVPAEALEEPVIDPASSVETSDAIEVIDSGAEVISEGGSFLSGFSTTQIVVTGVAVGLGLAVAGGGGGSNPISAE